jgi:benzoyl-CoA 2,3-dioxygenase component B
VARWNKWLERADRPERLFLPSTRFRRAIGSWAGLPVDPHGRRVEAAGYAARLAEWLPGDDDRAFIQSLMQPVRERGKMAGWIAPPERGLHGQPLDYDYVRLT